MTQPVLGHGRRTSELICDRPQRAGDLLAVGREQIPLLDIESAASIGVEDVSYGSGKLPCVKLPALKPKGKKTHQKVSHVVWKHDLCILQAS